MDKQDLVCKISDDFSSAFARTFVYENAIENPNEYHSWFNSCPNAQKFINEIKENVLQPVLQRHIEE